jgi:hypothetical protein
MVRVERKMRDLAPIQLKRVAQTCNRYLKTKSGAEIELEQFERSENIAPSCYSNINMSNHLNIGKRATVIEVSCYEINNEDFKITIASRKVLL